MASNGRVKSPKRRASQRRTLRQRDGNLCWVCGMAMDFTPPYQQIHSATFEHVLPVTMGGSNKLDNLRLTHRACNEIRSGKNVRAFQSGTRRSMPGEDSIGETRQCDACIEIRKKIAQNA